MAQSIDFPHEHVENYLVIRIDHNSPLAVSDLGRLFIDLSDDYSKMNKGRTLVVTRLQQGSLIAILQDAAIAVSNYTQAATEVFTALKSLKKFSEAVRGIINSAQSSGLEVDLFKGKRRAGIRSAESLLKIAIETKGDVTFQCRTVEGDDISIQINSLEAQKVRERARISAAKLAIKNESSPQIASVKQRLMLPTSPDSFADPRRIADEFAALAKSSGSLDKATLDTIREVVAVFASFLRMSGRDDVLESVAYDLEARGQMDLAEIVRSHINKGEGSATQMITRY